MSLIFQFAIVIWCTGTSIKRKVWKNFEEYYPTLLYLAVCNLIYEYIAHSRFHLWEMQGFGNMPEIIADFIYLFFIVIPAILIYLSSFPVTPKQKIIHIAKWIIIFTAVEWVGGKFFNAIVHQNGWNIWWSLAFNFIIFPTLRLHYLNFKWALVLSVPLTFFFLIWFDYI